MSGEIARLKTEIQARKYRAMELSGEIDRRVRDIKNALSGYPLAKIKDLPLPLVAQLASEATSLQAEYLQLISDIEMAERELQG